MVVLVLAGLSAIGGAVFSVLDRPVCRDRDRNTRVSVDLLTVSAVMLVAGLFVGVAGTLVS